MYCNSSFVNSIVLLLLGFLVSFQRGYIHFLFRKLLNKKIQFECLVFYRSNKRFICLFLSTPVKWFTGITSRVAFVTLTYGKIGPKNPMHPSELEPGNPWTQDRYASQYATKICFKPVLNYKRYFLNNSL